MRLVITASCRCDSSLGLNGRLHWAVRRRKTNAIRRVIRWAWLGQPVRPSVPCVVTLVRIGPRTMDDDNNQGALKSVRDEMAAMLGVDDGDERVTWRYSQEVGELVLAGSCDGLRLRFCGPCRLGQTFAWDGAFRVSVLKVCPRVYGTLRPPSFSFFYFWDRRTERKAQPVAMACFGVVLAEDRGCDLVFVERLPVQGVSQSRLLVSARDQSKSAWTHLQGQGVSRFATAPYWGVTAELPSW